MPLPVPDDNTTLRTDKAGIEADQGGPENVHRQRPYGQPLAHLRQRHERKAPACEAAYGAAQGDCQVSALPRLAGTYLCAAHDPAPISAAPADTAARQSPSDKRRLPAACA